MLIGLSLRIGKCLSFGPLTPSRKSRRNLLCRFKDFNASH